MTPIVLLANLGVSFAALAALCLSMNRHHAAAFTTKPSRRTQVGLRATGWAGIALCFGIAVAADGWNFGPVQWLGSLSGGALLVVALASYRPAWIRPAALLAVPLALVAAFIM
ncbi:MAG: DUF3325 domain-containing protein [Methylobacterium sp.]